VEAKLLDDGIGRIPVLMSVFEFIDIQDGNAVEIFGVSVDFSISGKEIPDFPI
jgi:hypothetical protein